MGDPTTRLLELDARHGELIDRLTVLDERIESVLTAWVQSKDISSRKTTEDSGGELATLLLPDIRKAA